jgi:TonB family protein
VKYGGKLPKLEFGRVLGAAANSPPWDRRRVSLLTSVGAHLLLLAWLVHTPAAVFVAPTFIRQGLNGTSTTSLYFAGQPEVSRAHLPTKKTLALNLPVRKSSAPKPDPKIETDSARDEAVLLPNERPAGSLYGSLSYGTLSGPDIRPALPEFFPDPVVDPSEIPGGEGDVIVEVVIDDQGNVVQEKILHSLGMSIDQRVLGSIARWHFRPATKNSVPMASKQDIYYHFPR